MSVIATFKQFANLDERNMSPSEILFLSRKSVVQSIKKNHQTITEVSDALASPGRRYAIKLTKIIGENIRAKRISLGLTLSELGDLVNLSYQQIQKYESGTNLISAVQLHSVAIALGTPISFFFQGLEDGRRKQKGRTSSLNVIHNLKANEVSEILEVFSSIHSRKLRKLMIETLKCIDSIEKK